MSINVNKFYSIFLHFFAKILIFLIFIYTINNILFIYFIGYYFF